MKNEDRANSVPDFPPINYEQHYDDSSLDGVAAPIKLLLKLIQDHKDACGKGKKVDSRRMLRVATMMTILETVQTRIKKCQSFGNKSESALRRCNTDLRLNHPPKDKKAVGVEATADEKEKLRRELSACTAARKRLEMMCSSLGKEKEIMAAELSRKVHELSEMEEHVNDLKAQNEKLVRRVHECIGEEPQGNIVLQEQNKYLAQMLVRTHDGYQSIKRKLNEVREDNAMVCSVIDEMREKIESSSSRVRRFEDRVGVDENIESLESMFEHLQTMVAKHDTRQEEEEETRWHVL